MSSRTEIIDMLKSRVPYAEIQAKLGVSSKTIAAAAKNAGIVQRHRDGAKTKESMDIKEASPALQVAGPGQVQDPAVLAENAALKEGARELYQIFLKIAENPKQARGILGNIDDKKIDGAVKYL